MANSNINIEELKLYLHHQLDATNIEIGKLTADIVSLKDSTHQQKQYDILNFRRLHLQTQLDNIYFNQA